MERTKNLNRKSLHYWCKKHGKYGKRLMDEWGGYNDKVQPLDISEIDFNSNENVLWKCKNKHTWYEAVSHRVVFNTECEKCKTQNENRKSLHDWCIKHGDYGQQLMKEWGGYDSKANKIEITEIDFKSDEKVLWKCQNKHDWYETVSRRVLLSTKCEMCKKEAKEHKQTKRKRIVEKKPHKTSAYGTSYPEQFIFHALKQIYADAENRCVVLKTKDNPHGYEFDVAIPSIPLCIEYSPTHWHGDKIDRDIEKMELCIKHNVRMIYIQEDSYDELEHKFEDNYFCFHAKDKSLDANLRHIICCILKSLGHSEKEVDFNKARIDAMNIMQHDCIKNPFSNLE